MQVVYDHPEPPGGHQATVFRPDGGTCVFISTWASSQQENQQTDHFPSRYTILETDRPCEVAPPPALEVSLSSGMKYAACSKVRADVNLLLGLPLALALHE